MSDKERRIALPDRMYAPGVNEDAPHSQSRTHFGITDTELVSRR